MRIYRTFKQTREFANVICAKDKQYVDSSGTKLNVMQSRGKMWENLFNLIMLDKRTELNSERCGTILNNLYPDIVSDTIIKTLFLC